MKRLTTWWQGAWDWCLQGNHRMWTKVGASCCRKHASEQEPEVRGSYVYVPRGTFDQLNRKAIAFDKARKQFLIESRKARIRRSDQAMVAFVASVGYLDAFYTYPESEVVE